MTKRSRLIGGLLYVFFKQHTLHTYSVSESSFSIYFQLSFRLFIVRLIHDLVLNFSGFSKFPFDVPSQTNRNRTGPSVDRSNAENYGPSRDASRSQPIRTRDSTGSSLCHIIELVNADIGKPKNKYIPAV